MEEELRIFNVSFDVLNQQQTKFPSLKKPRFSSFSKSYQTPYKQSRHATKISTSCSVRQNRNQSIGFTPRAKRLIKVVSPVSVVKPSSKFKLKPYANTPNLIDWKTSPLETCVLTNHNEFNWEQDSSLLNEYQIQIMQIEDVDHSYVAKSCLKNTVKRLCADLMLEYSTVDLMSDSQLLQYCKRLIKIRKFTLNLMKRIHEREHIMLRLITDSTCEKSDLQSKFMKLTFQSISQIKTWKNFSISSNQFIYDGQNYMKKIHNDLIFLESSITSKKTN